MLDTEEFPTSFAQQRLWFLDRLNPGESLYNIALGWRIDGLLDQAVMRAAIEEIVRRHEALRSTFRMSGGELVQVIERGTSFSFDVVEAPLEDELGDGGRRALAQLAGQAFDLETGPLMRVLIVRKSARHHFLLLALHHIATDGWSMGVLAGELNKLYKAFSQGLASPLQELPVQYADYAVWQREWLQGEALERQLTYWKAALEGASPLLELPLDRPRPVTMTRRGAAVDLELDASMVEGLRQLCRQAQVTAFMALAAVFNVLLSRYSRQDDVCIGYAVAGRRRKELEGLIGFFVNTLVLRTKVDCEQDFNGLLEQVRDAVLDADVHQDLPFEKLVEELHPERSLNHSPLFQVMFALDCVVEEAWDIPGLKFTPLRNPPSIDTKFDLTLDLTQQDGRMFGAIEYNSDLFDRSTIERMVGHFKTLLQAVVANPHSRVQDLPLLSEAERHQILVEWNDTKADFPQDKCIHQLFEEQVERTPEAVALVFEDQQLTYAQLNAKANQLAHYLRSLGVKPDTLVAICVERSLEMVVGLLAILKAGGAYVPIDPAYPGERISYMLDDARPVVLLTHSALVAALPATEAPVVALDVLDLSREPADNLRAEELGVQSRHLAYVIYTSGSTGKPKGVMVNHAGWINLAVTQQQLFGLTALSRVLQFASVSFDACAWELSMALCSGASLYLASRSDLLPGQPLALTLQHRSITHATLPPIAAFALPDPASFPALEVLVVAGESCPPALVNTWGHAPRFFNAYGPTETTVCATVQRARNSATRIPIGRPIANTQIHILDAQGALVPVGVPGEIHIGGAGVARGYLNRPELTRERFIPDPFGKPGSRMYTTGDLARYLPDGNIEFLGRTDHQVKIRGFRIELGEVEAALQRCERVREAVVLAREDEPGDKRLVAYVVPAFGALVVADLRAQLSSFLPEYMVPSTWVFLDNLPLNSNGKINRKALPAPELSRNALGIDYVAPRNSTEELLAGIWAEVLKVKSIGAHDNFFALGGHSLLVIRVVAQVNDALRPFPRMMLRDLYAHPSVRRLATLLEPRFPAGRSHDPKVKKAFVVVI